MIYVIATELVDPGQNGAAIKGWIEETYESWTHPIQNVWVVEGALVSEQIHTALEPLLGAADRLILVKAGSEAMWHGISDTSARWFSDVFPGSLSERIPGKTEGVAP